MRILYPFKNALLALRPCKAFWRSISASLPNPQTLPLGEGLCMLCWLCICAIVVVCCRCVLHRLCSTTCMRPCKALGHTRPASMPGLSVGLPPSPRLGLRPKPLSAFNGDIALPCYVSAFVYYKLPLELLFMNLPQPRSPKNSPSLNTSLPLE